MNAGMIATAESLGFVPGQDHRPSPLTGWGRQEARRGRRKLTAPEGGQGKGAGVAKAPKTSVGTWSTWAPGLFAASEKKASIA